MCASLPRNKDTTTSSAASEAEPHRLYLQYYAREFDYRQFFPSRPPLNRISNIVTTDKPNKMAIIPADTSIGTVLAGMNTDDTLNIVLEGQNLASLRTFSEIYHSFRHWNRISYMDYDKEIRFIQAYPSRTLSKFIRNKHNNSATLVVNTTEYCVQYVLCITFQGLVCGTKDAFNYTFHLKFKKLDSLDTVDTEPKRDWFYFNGAPIEGVLSDDEGMLEYHSNCKYSEPTIEFLFKSNDLAQLKRLRTHFMSLYLPSKKCRYRRCVFSFNLGSLITSNSNSSCSNVQYEVAVNSYDLDLRPTVYFK